VAIGLLADKTRSSYWLISGFTAMLLGALVLASGAVSASLHFMFFLSMIITASGTYAVRTLYFAVLPDANIPMTLTGTAVGLISVVGYTPDIFAGPIMGYLLDNSPGIAGHQNVFIMLAIFSLLGLVAAFLFARSAKAIVEKD